VSIALGFFGCRSAVPAARAPAPPRRAAVPAAPRASARAGAATPAEEPAAHLRPSPLHVLAIGSSPSVSLHDLRTAALAFLDEGERASSEPLLVDGHGARRLPAGLFAPLRAPAECPSCGAGLRLHGTWPDDLWATLDEHGDGAGRALEYERRGGAWRFVSEHDADAPALVRRPAARHKQKAPRGLPCKELVTGVADAVMLPSGDYVELGNLCDSTYHPLDGSPGYGDTADGHLAVEIWPRGGGASIVEPLPDAEGAPALVPMRLRVLGPTRMGVVGACGARAKGPACGAPYLARRGPRGWTVLPAPGVAARCDLAITPEGELWIADRNAVYRSAAGASGWTEVALPAAAGGELAREPAEVVALADGTVLVTARANGADGQPRGVLLSTQRPAETFVAKGGEP
jgi:hypothetical protein